jgi:hypothetical protein
MRITSDFDLRGLGPNARKQIKTAMGGRPISNAKRFTSVPVSKSQQRGNEKMSAKGKVSVESKGKSNKPSRIHTDEITGLKFCPFPSTDPAVWLHVALEKEFGSYWSGGDMISELILPGHEVAFRYDFAILSAKIMIEFDGWAFHNKRDAFKRDREKHRHALLKGWVTLPITNSMVRNELGQIISDTKKLCLIRQIYDVPIIISKGKTQSVYPY